MRFLDTERAALSRWIPDLASELESMSLSEREADDGRAIESFRRCGGPGLLVPSVNQGRGAGARDAVQVQRAVAASSPSLAVATTMHHFSVASLIETARVSQGLEWMLLEAIATENKIVASGFSEGVRGQSVLRPTLRGHRDGRTYRLSGSKRPCSLSRSMDLLTASVVIEDQSAVAVVPAGSDGMRVEPFWSAPVLRGAQSDAVVLDDVVVDEALVVAGGSIDDTAMDSIQSAGFLWFELLMTASYLGMASALVERVLDEGRGSAGERADLAGRLETCAAAVELVAHDLDEQGPCEHLLPRALMARYTAQATVASVAATAVELLGGMTFITDSFVHVYAGSVGCLAFHPPSRSRAADAIADALKGAPFVLS